MARQFVEASDQFLSNPNAVITSADYPFWMFCWFYADSLNGIAPHLMGVFDSSGTNWFSLAIRNAGNANDGKVACNSVASGSGSNFALSSAASSLSTWHLAVGVWPSNSSRKAYLDGGNKGTVTGDTKNVSGVDRTALGTLYDGSGPRLSWDGRIAEAGIVSGEPSDDLVASMYQGGIGIDHRLVDPQNMLAYWRLLEDDGDIDWYGTYDMTPTNSPTYADHVPIVNLQNTTISVFGEGLPGSIVKANASGVVQTIGTAVRDTI